MVSQPETSSSVSYRGPSSVVSRPSLSRTKRYNRSHVGGAAYAPQNEFPVFSQSGDVEIVIRVTGDAVENRYLLHRHTLTRCSGFFEASTSEQWSRARPLLAGGNELARIGEHDTPTGSLVDSDIERDGSSTAPRGGGGGGPRKRWRYVLDMGKDDNDIPMLVQQDESRDAAAAAGRSKVPSLFGPGDDTIRPSNRSMSRSKASHAQSPSVGSNRDFFRSVANLNPSSSSISNGHHSSHSSHGHHYSSATSSSISSATRVSKAEQDLLRDYDNLFRTMYNYPPVLDGVNVADAYIQCKSLLNLADQYDALGVVGPRVDHHLLQFQSRLWRQIAKYPISYLRLGYLAKSKVIFQEALIHVVGQWPAGERSLRTALSEVVLDIIEDKLVDLVHDDAQPEVVLDIIEDKVDELEETVSRVEGRLFRLGLVTGRGERVTPHTNYLDWLAVSLFRQWIADNTAPQPAHPPENHHNNNHHRRQPSRDGGRTPLPPPVAPPTSIGRAYRTLGSSQPLTYLSHDECKRFLKLTPDMYTRDNLRRFEKRIEELKAMARDIVRPLMNSGLELELSGSSKAAEISYLTCTEVGNRDLPWAIEN